MNSVAPGAERAVRVPAGAGTLPGTLVVPGAAHGIVVFAHGSGSSRMSPRNRMVAAALQRGGAGTLLFDLLSEAESHDRATVFNVPLLAQRLSAATDWLAGEPSLDGLRVGYFGASTGAAAALVAAAGRGNAIAAVVSRGGRPDLAGRALGVVEAPTLLIVGGRDEAVLDLNRTAYQELRCPKRLEIVPGAAHLFEEPGMLERVAALASDWFETHLASGT